MSPVLLAVYKTTSEVGQDGSFAVRLQGFEHPGNPFTAGRSYPVAAGRSPHSVYLFEVYPYGLDPLLPEDLLSWAFTYRWSTLPARGQARISIGMFALQSVKEPQSWLLSFERNPPP
jgi:hypothetical protein